jgi:ATP-dependent helicase/nuclease subunit B
MILTKSLEKSIDLDFEIDRIIKENRLEELLLIVPTNRKSRYLKKEMISLASSEAVSEINIETIGTFSTKIFFGDQKASQKVLSESASTVLLRQSFQEIKTKYFANYFGDIPSGTLERIRNVISEYKRHGITPEGLRYESRNLKLSEKNKAEDIAEIYLNYQKKIKELDVNELGDIYSAVYQNSFIEFSDKFRILYPNVHLIVINGFDEFTSPEIEIIDLVSTISNSRLFLTFDYYKFNPLIFSHLKKCYSKLLEKGFREIEDTSQASLNLLRQTVRENLFLKKSLKPSVQSLFEDKLKIIKAKNREAEIELTAKEIKDLIIKENVEPHRICVAFNLIQKYSPVIRDLFSLYGLPFNLTDRFSLGNSSPVIAFINFLEILENDYFYKNIFRALSSGYINIEGVDLSSLLKASRDLKILSGYERWTTALNDALNYEITDDPFERFARKKDAFKKALKSLQILNDYLRHFKGKLTIQEFREKFVELIFKLEIPVTVINDKSHEVEKNTKAVNTFIEITDEILNLLQEEYGNSEKFCLKFFLNQLRTAVVSARYNIKEKPGYGVQVTTLNEIRGLEFDYLFICGMCDGDLPLRYTPEIFLSGSFYRYEENHQTEERYHFYQALCSWKKGLYLSYPLSEERKELMQSNFLTEIKNLFGGSIPESRIEVKTEADYKGTIYSKEEYLKLAGEVDIKLLNEKFGTPDIINAADIDKAKIISYQRSDKINEASPFAGDIYSALNTSDKEWLNELKFRQYSVSQLEVYAKCPYKFFAERILKLEEIDEPTEEVEALEMGSLLHNIFYEFYKELKNRKIVLYECSDGEFNFARELLFSIADRKIDEADFKSPLSFYEREKILGLNGKRENSILYEFLKNEKELSDGFVPEFLEVSFGKVDNENLPDPIKNLKAKGVSIRGKIDRVDVNKEEKIFRVIDYKLGGKNSSLEKDIELGIALQLPLYMYAAKELIKAQLNKDYEADGADIYSLKFSKEKFGRKVVRNLSGEKSETEKFIEDCLNSVEKYVTSISSGKFHLTKLNDRENKVCRFCSFRSVCRIEEKN